ncbi:MAG: hypothetical protein ACNI27_12960 [Desulfovibrio sp.]
MTFTPLETLLISTVLSILVGVCVRGGSVSKGDCEKQSMVMDKKFTIVFRMLRGLVVHSDIPDDKKAEILNEKGDS